MSSDAKAVPSFPVVFSARVRYKQDGRAAAAAIFGHLRQGLADVSLVVLTGVSA